MPPIIVRSGHPGAARVIGALAHTPGAQFLLPLVAAIPNGLTLVFVSDQQISTSALRRALDRLPEPVTLIIDGDDYRPGAPADWRCTRAALAWARVAIVHGAAGARAHYELAVLAAAATGRLLLVHCASAEAQDWTAAAAAARLRPLMIVPERGEHPLPERAEGPLQ